MTAAGQAQPPVTTLAHGGEPAEIEPFLRTLGYNDQMHLLVWMCQQCPEVAARGAACLIEFHAQAAKRRKRGRRSPEALARIRRQKSEKYNQRHAREGAA